MTDAEMVTLTRCWAVLHDPERAALVRWFSREGVDPKAARAELDRLADKWIEGLRRAAGAKGR